MTECTVIVKMILNNGDCGKICLDAHRTLDLCNAPLNHMMAFANIDLYVICGRGIFFCDSGEYLEMF